MPVCRLLGVQCDAPKKLNRSFFGMNEEAEKRQRSKFAGCQEKHFLGRGKKASDLNDGRERGPVSRAVFKTVRDFPLSAGRNPAFSKNPVTLYQWLA